MHILLIEASLSGHHSIYLERTAIVFLGAGHTVTIALPIGIKNTENLLEELQEYSSVRWIYYKAEFNLGGTDLRGLVSREFSVRKVFGRTYDEVNNISRVDYVFLPYMDYCLYAISLFGSPFGATKFGGICMRPSFHYIECGVIAPKAKLDFFKQALFIRLLNNKTLLKIFSIDELLVNNLVRKIPRIASKIEYLPDPVDAPVNADPILARKTIGTPIDSKVMLVYGSLDERKGIKLLLDTLVGSDSLDNWHVWLIGRQSDSIRELIASDRWIKLHRQNRIQCYDEFVSIATERAVFGACDAVWAVYENHYSMSGVIVHAGLYGRCVIACKSGLIGYYAHMKKIGVIASSSIESIKISLLKIEDAKVRIQYGSNGKETFINHTWMNFKDKLLK